MFPVAVFWGSTRKSCLHLVLEEPLALRPYFLYVIVSAVNSSESSPALAAYATLTNAGCVLQLQSAQDDWMMSSSSLCTVTCFIYQIHFSWVFILSLSTSSMTASCQHAGHVPSSSCDCHPLMSPGYCPWSVSLLDIAPASTLPFSNLLGALCTSYKMTCIFPSSLPLLDPSLDFFLDASLTNTHFRKSLISIT